MFHSSDRRSVSRLHGPRVRSAEAPLHHDTTRAARRVFESFTPDLEIAFAHRIGYRHAQTPLPPTSKPGARDRDGVSSLIHFRRRSCSMDIVQFARGSQHPVASSRRTASSALMWPGTLARHDYALDHGLQGIWL